MLQLTVHPEATSIFFSDSNAPSSFLSYSLCSSCSSSKESSPHPLLSVFWAYTSPQRGPPQPPLQSRAPAHPFLSLLSVSLMALVVISPESLFSSILKGCPLKEPPPYFLSWKLPDSHFFRDHLVPAHFGIPVPHTRLFSELQSCADVVYLIWSLQPTLQERN